MKRIHFLMSGCLFLAVSGLFAIYESSATDAQPPAKHKASMDRILIYYFKQMDLNGDNVITRKEREKTITSPNMADFNDLDLNGDGELTMKEYRKAFLEIHNKPEELKI